jgi:hypothetical protein
MRYFWPIYLVAAAAGTAGVYIAAPFARPYAPAFLKPSPASAPDGSGPPPAPANPSEPRSAEPSAPAVPAQTAAPAGSPPSQHATADELPPALHGIYLAQRGEKPSWGITRQQTVYYTLDGARVGTVDGGILIDFLGARTSSRGSMVECVLHAPNVPATPLLISLDDACLFIGDYRKLSANQTADLKTYYVFSDKIAQRKKELLQVSATKNPFFETYQARYKILMAHVDKAKELTVQRDKAMDLERLRIEEQLSEMKVAENQIRREYQELHQKFKTWKEQHAGEIPQPENDPSIQQWTRQRAELISRIPGLAY